MNNTTSMNNKPHHQPLSNLPTNDSSSQSRQVSLPPYEALLFANHNHQSSQPIFPYSENNHNNDTFTALNNHPSNQPMYSPRNNHLMNNNNNNNNSNNNTYSTYHNTSNNNNMMMMMTRNNNEHNASSNGTHYSHQAMYYQPSHSHHSPIIHHHHHHHQQHHHPPQTPAQQLYHSHASHGQPPNSSSHYSPTTNMPQSSQSFGGEISYFRASPTHNAPTSSSSSPTNSLLLSSPKSSSQQQQPPPPLQPQHQPSISSNAFLSNVSHAQHQQSFGTTVGGGGNIDVLNSSPQVASPNTTTHYHHPSIPTPNSNSHMFHPHNTSHQAPGDATLSLPNNNSNENNVAQAVNAVMCRGNLPKKSVELLKSWLQDHFTHPYPSDAEKDELSKMTGLTLTQVNNWFINARRRIWRPMVDQEQKPKTPSDGKKDQTVFVLAAIGASGEINVIRTSDPNSRAMNSVSMEENTQVNHSTQGVNVTTIAPQTQMIRVGKRVKFNGDSAELEEKMKREQARRKTNKSKTRYGQRTEPVPIVPVKKRVPKKNHLKKMKREETSEKPYVPEPLPECFEKVNMNCHQMEKFILEEISMVEENESLRKEIQEMQETFQNHYDELMLKNETLLAQLSMLETAQTLIDKMNQDMREELTILEEEEETEELNDAKRRKLGLRMSHLFQIDQQAATI